MQKVIVIGGGPAGLTTAYELKKRDEEIAVTVYEADKLVGGISRTESYRGFRIDIGGHRFFTKVGEVEKMWHEVLESDFIRVRRMSRIYYKNRFFDYPLRIFNALSNIGAYESVRILLSYLKWQARPHRHEENFEQWVMNRFGGRLYMHFFRSYTEKVWGIPPDQIRADWAAQRIKNLSLSKAVWNSISGANDTASLIEEFNYPRLGPGMMWEKTAALINDDRGKVILNSRAEKLERSGNKITAVHVTDENGTHRIEGDHFVNSMGLRDLIKRIDPPPPQKVLDAADDLSYRDFMIVALVLNSPDPFPDNWIYVHSGDVKVGRIQNFRAWSKEMVPNETQASIGMEYFCQENDEFWVMEDEDLIAQAASELEQIGLAKADMVVDAYIIRQPKAYPVYDTKYKSAVDTIAEWIKGLENFQTVGRNGLHRYNNQDHSMLTGMLAARNILGEKNDLWTVNVERSYHEEFQREEEKDHEISKAS